MSAPELAPTIDSISPGSQQSFHDSVGEISSSSASFKSGKRSNNSFVELQGLRKSFDYRMSDSNLNIGVDLEENVDTDVESFSRNSRFTREFSFSNYDISVRHFPRKRLEYNRLPAWNNYERSSSEGEIIQSRYPAEEQGNYDDDNPRCLCDDCLQNSDNECECEKCLVSKESADTGISPDQEEIISDCEDCLINSGNYETCDCEKCQHLQDEETRSTPSIQGHQCDGDACLNDSGYMNCHCEKCQLSREVNRTPSQQEIICECEACVLNADNQDYICECEGCQRKILDVHDLEPFHDDDDEQDEVTELTCYWDESGKPVWTYDDGEAVSNEEDDSSRNSPQGHSVLGALASISEETLNSSQSCKLCGMGKGNMNENEVFYPLMGEKTHTDNGSVSGQSEMCNSSGSFKQRDVVHRYPPQGIKWGMNSKQYKAVDTDKEEKEENTVEVTCEHCAEESNNCQQCVPTSCNRFIPITIQEEEEEELDENCGCDTCINQHSTTHTHKAPGLLENQLQKTEKELKRKESEYTKEISELKKDNDRHQKIIEKSLNLSPDAKIEATMQHEITRLTSENLDLRETIDKQNEQIRKLKKMLKVYAKRLKEGDAAEIQAELEMEEAKSVENVAQIIHRERNYLGMLEYKKEDEAGLIKNLITDLKPRVATGLLPGLPAYILFMCVRHTDYINDDEKVRSLLTSSINGIKKAVKKHHDDLDRVTMWLANTCRLLHTLKQYSGEKAFQAENTSRQNEHCLRNFDLSEYRQVFSDLAIWIYQTLIKQMEATIQPTIVPAVLEHEAIAGLSGSKPSGMRGRSGSRHGELDHQEVSLESLMKTLNSYMRVLTQHAVDPELIKQIFRQVYYFLCACALNNLLLRKDMCNWSKGMQIRYNLSHLEQWLRDNKLNESGAQAALEPIIQASQLLQARKTDADVESVCDMCSKLTVAQIVKILNLYTPVDEFEERVPITFIRKIQERLKGRPPSDNTLLMDLKFSYSVTFPFNPSSIAMETIEVPESLHMGFLTRL